MRPHQYVKNALILLPAFFAQRITDLELIGKTFGVFVGFCMLASAVYILNDYVDREADRLHPEKCNRPLASGAISPRAGFIQMALLLLLGGLIIGTISLDALMVAVAYFVLNISYSFRLKHVAIIDIFIIALGFVMRLFIGSMTGDIALSMWIILMTFLLALFLALAKRRDDVLLAAQGKNIRKAIDGYNLEFINGAMIIMASVTIVAYISYTTLDSVEAYFNSKHVYLSVFFVLLGILRYLQISFVEQKSGSPTRVLLRDIFLQLVMMGWAGTFVVILYLR